MLEIAQRTAALVELGQEIVARTHFLGKAKRSLQCFAAAGPVVAGASVRHEAQGVGEVELIGELERAMNVWVDADRAPVLKDAAADFTKDSGVKVKLVQKDFGKIQDEFTEKNIDTLRRMLAYQ